MCNKIIVTVTLNGEIKRICQDRYVKIGVLTNTKHWRLKNALKEITGKHRKHKLRGSNSP